MNVKLSDKLHPVPSPTYLLFYAIAILSVVGGFALMAYSATAHQFVLSDAIRIGAPAIIFGVGTTSIGWVIQRRRKIALAKHNEFEKQLSDILNG